MDNLHNEILDLYEKLYVKVNVANKSNKKTQRKGKLTIWKIRQSLATEIAL